MVQCGAVEGVDPYDFQFGELLQFSQTIIVTIVMVIIVIVVL